MSKKIVKVSGIFLSILLFFLVIRAYFKLIYFPAHPTIYSEYQQRGDYDPSLDGKKIELLEPPIGGCFNICWGKEQTNNCDYYSRKWGRCEVSCNGYVYNNCSSLKLGIIIGLLSK